VTVSEFPSPQLIVSVNVPSPTPHVHDSCSPTFTVVPGGNGLKVLHGTGAGAVVVTVAVTEPPLSAV
jgi:hypothetical protein